MKVWLFVMAIVLASQGTLLAADPRYPDWPCNQIKVPEMSVAAVWAGPPVDDVANVWEQDAAIRDLVIRLAARRTPLEDAQRMISDAITGDAAERQHKAKLIFAGLFKALNQERSEVMDIHHVADDQRPAFVAAQNAGRERPRHLQLADVVGRDLLELRVTLVSVIARRHHPILWVLRHFYEFFVRICSAGSERCNGA